jgi:hypothetical protein
MKIGDRVYVNWPTGKGGPYTVERFWYVADEVKVVVDGEHITVPGQWCEPAEPEIEEGRLYYVCDYDEPSKERIMRGREFVSALWDHVEPVHRRWEELEGSEKYELNSVVKNDEDPNNVKTIFHHIYKLITGEEHP